MNEQDKSQLRCGLITMIAAIVIMVVGIATPGCDDCSDGVCDNPANGAELASRVPSDLSSLIAQNRSDPKVQQAMPGIVKPGVLPSDGAKFAADKVETVNVQQRATPPAQVNPLRQRYEYLYRWLNSVPADDRDSIYFTAFVHPNGAQSAEFLSDIKTDTMLKQIVAWSGTNANIYDISQSRGLQTARAWNVTATPYLVIHTSEFAQNIPKRTAIYTRTSYNGNGPGLAEDIAEAISSLIQAHDYRRYSIPVFDPDAADQPDPYDPGPYDPYDPYAPITPNAPRIEPVNPPALPPWAPRPDRPRAPSYPNRQPGGVRVNSWYLIGAFTLTVAVLMTWSKARRVLRRS